MTENTTPVIEERTTKTWTGEKAGKNDVIADKFSEISIWIYR